MYANRQIICVLLASTALSLATTVAAEPNAPDSPAAKAHNDAAKALAADNPVLNFPYKHYCVQGYRFARPGEAVDQVARPGDFLTPKGYVQMSVMQTVQEPTRVFDEVYYFGYQATGLFVVKTTQGLIVIDALNNGQDIDRIVAPGMQKFGLDPKDIKFIILTHQHGDHYGGINRLLELAPSAKVVAGKPDADELEARRKAGIRPADANGRGGMTAEALALIPKRFDIRVASNPGSPNGQQDLTLGATTIKMALVPSHTIGMLSLIVPVHDRGTPHLVGVWGGNHIDEPDVPAKAKQYTASLDYFHSLTTAAGVDAFMHPHMYQADGYRLMDQMRADPKMPNPFVIGTDAYNRYLGIWTECMRAYSIRSAEGTWKRF